MFSGLWQWYCWILNTTWYKSKWWVGQCRHLGAMWCRISAPLHHLCNYLMCDLQSLAPKLCCLKDPFVSNLVYEAVCYNETHHVPKRSAHQTSGVLLGVWQAFDNLSSSNCERLTFLISFPDVYQAKFSRGNGLSWHKRRLSKSGCVSISHY